MEMLKNKTGNMSELKIYNDFDNNLRSICQDFYNSVDGNYNLSFDWCKCWFKYYGNKKKPFIITLWKDNEIKLLAPFYLYKNKLYLIGSTYPDFYIESNILSREDKYINDLADYIIFEKRFGVDFKYLNAESSFAKIFMRKLQRASFLHKKIYGFDMTPSVDLSMEFKKRVLGRVKKGKTKAKNKYHKEVAIEFISERNEDTLDEFISLHKKRWNGGFFSQYNVEKFIKEIFLSTDLFLLARLYFKEDNTTLAYDFIYKNSCQRLLGYQGAYNSEFSEISPNILILYDVMIKAKQLGFKSYDLGSGGFEYKYDFATQDFILFNIITNQYQPGQEFLESLLNFTRKFLKSLKII